MPPIIYRSQHNGIYACAHAESGTRETDDTPNGRKSPHGQADTEGQAYVYESVHRNPGGPPWPVSWTFHRRRARRFSWLLKAYHSQAFSTTAEPQTTKDQRVGFQDSKLTTRPAEANRPAGQWLNTFSGGPYRDQTCLSCFGYGAQ